LLRLSFKRRSIFFFVLAAVVFTAGASYSEGGTLFRYLFTPGEQFETYGFLKLKTVLPDGSLDDLRVNLLTRYKTIEATAEQGALLESHLSRIEVARFNKHGMVGSAVAKRSSGVKKFKDAPGFSEQQLLDFLEPIRHERVSATGLLLAIGKASPPPSPLAVEDWSKVDGFNVPGTPSGNFPLEAFSFIGPDTPVAKGTIWTAATSVPLRMKNTRVGFLAQHRVAGIGDSAAQVVTFGELDGRVYGDKVTVRSGRLFCQSWFDIIDGFVMQHQCESEIEYDPGSGKVFKQTIQFRTNNTKVLRLNRR
jgi:hypothetical protein